MVWDAHVDSLGMQRQAGPGSSLGSLGRAGSLPPCGRSVGPRGEMRAETWGTKGEGDTWEVGVEMREAQVMGQGRC